MTKGLDITLTSRSRLDSIMANMGSAALLADKRVVIFDLFFTLVSPDIDDDEFPPTYEVLGVDKMAWREQVFGTSNARLTGGEMDPYRIVGNMARAIDPSISDSTIRDATEQRIARFERVLMSVPETTISVLDALRTSDIKTALITNADVIETQGWDASPLASLFDVCIFSWRVGYAKPDIRIYNHCLERLGVSSSEAIFVGDGGSDELKGARAAGLTSIFVTGLMPELSDAEVRDRKSCADYTIGEIPELLPLLLA